jgi:hypothetical protein
MLGLRAAKRKAEAMSRRSEEGIALIAVLWALTLLSIITHAMHRSSPMGLHIMGDWLRARVSPWDGFYMQRPLRDGRSARAFQFPVYVDRMGALDCGSDPREGPRVTAEVRIEELDGISRSCQTLVFQPSRLTW